MTSFKNYNIIDYDHKYTFDGEWYQRNLGTPLKMWQSQKSTTYEDVFGVERTTPPGTWWLRSMITDPDAIKELDNKTLNSYSLTTANKSFADKIMNLTVHNPISTKNNVPMIPPKVMEELKQEHGMTSDKHRTLIKDIKDPVGFTVSLTGFPCVGGAVFAKKCLETSRQSNKNNGDNMTDGINLSFDNLKELLSMKNKKDDNDVYVTKEELSSVLEENNKTVIEEISKVIDDKLPDKTDADDKDKDKGTDKDEPGKDEGDKGADNQQSDDKGTDNADDGADNNTSNKSQPGSKQIDHKDDGNDDQSFKRGTNEYNLLSQLGRDGMGNSKIRL